MSSWPAAACWATVMEVDTVGSASGSWCRVVTDRVAIPSGGVVVLDGPLYGSSISSTFRGRPRFFLGRPTCRGTTSSRLWLCVSPSSALIGFTSGLGMSDDELWAPKMSSNRSDGVSRIVGALGGGTSAASLLTSLSAVFCRFDRLHSSSSFAGWSVVTLLVSTPPVSINTGDVRPNDVRLGRPAPPRRPPTRGIDVSSGPAAVHPFGRPGGFFREAKSDGPPIFLGRPRRLMGTSPRGLALLSAF
ncbi:hypothetical protein H257_02876 [Aphanomyces astaci]|uniref:Uncharacterized protein n=1 Tax=Aphanomyces astaci TaxID=112090 RepID=W4H1F1_APHAT|nr:hypothetical protein H257_02876 [Aphanomyces astaci]ETV84983.1 hypothetical protein H257_02876 [Aphanomyces astaci]|eukprot:XP_009825001.1 hypothetical protein H257_02876 [Aphanomyces astaci]